MKTAGRHALFAMLTTGAAIQCAATAAAGKGEHSAAYGIAESTVRAHMGFLASDAMNGRGSGTRDEWITATYIAAQLRRMQLQPLGDNGDYVQSVEITRTEVVGVPLLSIGAGTKIGAAQLYVMKLSGAPFHGSLQKYRADSPVHPGSALLMPKDAAPASVSGLQAAGLVLWHETPALHARWSDLLRRLVIVGQPRLVGLSADSQSRVPGGPAQVVLTDDAYAAVAQDVGESVVSLEATTREASIHTWNAVGSLPGSEKRSREDIILLTAHLDHLGVRDTGVDRIYNGADDDASGTTAVLTLAEALAKGGALKRTVVFAWFGGEEAGGFGARYFVEKPVVPLERIVANLEFEMMGRPDSSIAPHTLWLTGWERTTLGVRLAAHGAKLVADPHPKENFFARSDNNTLARRGIVAQTVSSFGLHADYHQPSDDLEHIDFAHMTQTIQSLLAPIRWLADSGFKPEWTPGGRPE